MIETTEFYLCIQGVRCKGKCTDPIQKAIRALPEVRDCVVDFATHIATIRLRDPLDERSLTDFIENQISNEVKKVDPQFVVRDVTEQVKQGQNPVSASSEVTKICLWRAFWPLLISLPLFIAGFWGLPPLSSSMGYALAWLQAVMSVTCLWYSGRHYYRQAWREGIRAMSMNMLVSLSTLSAWLLSLGVLILAPEASIGLYFVPVMMILGFVNGGEALQSYIESKVLTQHTSIVPKLLQVQMHSARVKRSGQQLDFGKATYEEKSLATLKAGDFVEVRTGERFPCTGTLKKVRSGECHIKSLFGDGEHSSSKQIGDEIQAGDLNSGDWVVIEVTNPSNQFLTKQSQAFEGQHQKTKFIDSVSRALVPVMIVIACLSALGWWTFAGDLATAVTSFFSVLVAACPCSLLLVEPMTYYFARTRLSARGVQVWREQAFGDIARANAVVFDKTGTLTTGDCPFKEIILANDSQYSETDIWRWVASIENKSKHPLAKSLVKKAKQANVALSQEKFLPELDANGISAVLEGKKIILGNAAFILAQTGLDITGEDSGNVIHCAIGEPQADRAGAFDYRFAASFYFEDKLAPHTVEIIRYYHAHDIKVVIATGAKDAALLLKQLCGAGIDVSKIDVHTNQSFARGDKEALVKTLKSQGYKVFMVGDGANDSAALAACTGIVLGEDTVFGEQVKIQDLMGLVRLRQASILTQRFLKFAYALCAVVVGLGLSYASGLCKALSLTESLLPPEIAALLMACTSVVITVAALGFNHQVESIDPNTLVTHSMTPTARRTRGFSRVQALLLLVFALSVAAIVLGLRAEMMQHMTILDAFRMVFALQGQSCWCCIAVVGGLVGAMITAFSACLPTLCQAGRQCRGRCAQVMMDCVSRPRFGRLDEEEVLPVVQYATSSQPNPGTVPDEQHRYACRIL